jgi:hypothetical protein
MELFTASDKSQWEVIQRWISDSDIYMVILGGRYGSIEPTSGLSYIEMEYDLAVQMGKPYFAVVISETALEIRGNEHGTAVLENDYPDKLDTFRKKVLCKMSSFYSEPKDVKLCVAETLPKLAEEYNLKGWVRATEIPDVKAIADELMSLQTENRALKNEITILSQDLDRRKVSERDVCQEFEELIDVMKKIMIDVSGHKIGKSRRDVLPKEISLYELAYGLKDALMSGITNHSGMDNAEKMLYYDLCPKLQTYELVQNEPVPGAWYRRYAITKKGTQFFAFIEKKMYGNKPIEKNKPET